MDWFLYGNGLRHERVKDISWKSKVVPIIITVNFNISDNIYFFKVNFYSKKYMLAGIVLN